MIARFVTTNHVPIELRVLAELHDTGPLGQGAEELAVRHVRCAVRRQRPGEPERRGNLRHCGRGWLFDYLPGRNDDNEILFRADRHLIEKGLYISVTEEDGIQRPFRILDVKPLAGSPG
mgnify:CR=1 FL=1